MDRLVISRERMKKRGGSRLGRLLSVAFVTGILCVVPIRPAMACHAFSFESATYSVAEDAGHVVVVVTRNRDGHQPEDGTSSVKVSTSDQSAESGKDYAAFNQDVSFGPTETSKRIEITILDDTVYEGSENFSVKLSSDPGSPQECTFGYGGFAPSPNPTVVTIQENDPQGSGTAPQQPGSQPATKAPAAAPGPASSPPPAAPAAASPSPAAGEEIGENVAADVPKQEEEGPPIKTILLIAGIVLVVGGAIGGYYYLGTRD